jgi:hypothetical protein
VLQSPERQKVKINVTFISILYLGHVRISRGIAHLPKILASSSKIIPMHLPLRIKKLK